MAYDGYYMEIGSRMILEEARREEEVEKIIKRVDN